MTACGTYKNSTYAPVKNQGVSEAVLDPIDRPMPNFNGLRYRWGGGVYNERYQIVVDLDSKVMAWSRHTYQSTAPDSDEITALKYKRLSPEYEQQIIKAANRLWASKKPLERGTAVDMPGDLTLYASGTVLTSCCGGGESALSQSLRNSILNAFAEQDPLFNIQTVDSKDTVKKPYIFKHINI
jgi:hypothetical protein